MRVRIAVAIDDGENQFEACGSSSLIFPLDAARESLIEAGFEPMRFVWVEAEIPDLPKIAGAVVPGPFPREVE